MSQYFKYIIGPEFYWLAWIVAMKVLGQRNTPPTEAGSQALEAYWYWLALAAVPLTFAAFFVPGVPRGWLLLRIFLSAGIGVCVASYVLTGYIDYRDSRNSGVPMGWMLSMGLGWMMLVVGSAIAGVVLLWMQRKSAG
jgi:hypothetical protein